MSSVTGTISETEVNGRADVCGWCGFVWRRGINRARRVRLVSHRLRRRTVHGAAAQGEQQRSQNGEGFHAAFHGRLSFDLSIEIPSENACGFTLGYRRDFSRLLSLPDGPFHQAATFRPRSYFLHQVVADPKLSLSYDLPKPCRAESGDWLVGIF